ncbi:MAG: hypothetical protein KTR18_00625 [Acidiferrobacterales bacterium]|nr:hypothetical protein [Acidiferrobacterales bacterium]
MLLSKFERIRRGSVSALNLVKMIKQKADIYGVFLCTLQTNRHVIKSASHYSHDPYSTALILAIGAIDTLNQIGNPDPTILFCQIKKRPQALFYRDQT